jgi:transposase
MRRTHLRGRKNVLKRLLIHVGGFNLSLVLRKALGAGTPRGLRRRKRPCSDLANASGGC